MIINIGTVLAVVLLLATATEVGIVNRAATAGRTVHAELVRIALGTLTAALVALTLGVVMAYVGL